MSSNSVCQTLRIACMANDLPTYGSAAQLLARLVDAGKRSKAPATGKKIPAAHKKKSANVGKIIKPKHMQPTKKVKNGHGERLSAASYFHDDCDGKISRCTPKMVLQPDGTRKLCEIVMIDGPHGRYPRWSKIAGKK